MIETKEITYIFFLLEGILILNSVLDFSLYDSTHE